MKPENTVTDHDSYMIVWDAVGPSILVHDHTEEIAETFIFHYSI